MKKERKLDINRKKKISQEDFSIPTYKQFNFLNEYDYKVPMLKIILKKYNLPVGGKKDELINRLYNYLKNSYYVLNIQKIGRGYLQRKYNKFIINYLS